MLLSASPKREIVKRGRSNEPSKRLESKSTVAFSSCRENSRVGLLLFGYSYTIPSLTVGKIKMATNPVNMGSVAVFYFVTICAIL